MKSPEFRPSWPLRPYGGGFTLVELMVALALAAMISVSIMVISNQAQDAYEMTARRVEVYNKFRFALLAVERDFSHWIPTANLEFFIDGRGPNARRNENWDPQEELPDPPGQPGVVDGGNRGEFDEFAYIIQRHYYANGKDGTRKLHDAYQAYFRTLTFVDGRVREANIEYMLLDPNVLDKNGNPSPPLMVNADKMGDLSLYKVIRYHDIGYGEIERPMANFPIVRKYVEVCTNITDFKIEYTADNRFDRRALSGFRTPREDSDEGTPAERDVRALRVVGTDSLPGGPYYRKTFGYGGGNIQKTYRLATAFRGIFGDRIPRADHRPVQFGWQQEPNIRFAELTLGDKIYIFTEAARGGGGGGIGVAGIASALTAFPAGVYTVKTNLGGRLEFYEDIDSATWVRDIPGVRYKAAFIPDAVRITIRVIDESTGKEARTLQKVIWIRRKAR